MASDETKQPSKQRVVDAIKASKNWKGAYQADYNCPKCRSPLMSLDDTLLRAETCPNCNSAFVFGAGVQTDYRTHKAAIERKEAEKQRVAEQRKQLAEERNQAADVDRARQIDEERAYVQRSIAEKKVIDRERNQRISARRSSLSGVELGIGTVSAISFLGSLISVVVGITALTSDNPVAGMTLLLAGVISLVSLLLVYGLFRCLFAIHQLLTDISGKLDEDRAKG